MASQQYRNVALRSLAFRAGLHLVFAAAVVTVLTLEYLQNHLISPARWFWANDYGFFVLLGALRLVAGGLLLARETR
jgi:hypothetical protein